MSEWMESGDGFAELRSRLGDDVTSSPLRGDLKPVRPYSPGRSMTFFLALFVPLAALILWRVFGWRPDHGALGSPWMWGLSAVELTAALVLLSRVLREAIPARSSSLALLTFAAAGTAVLHVAVNLATFNRSQVYPVAGHEWTIGLQCFAFEVALGIPCVLFVLWLGRRGLTSRPRRLGVIGGIGAGLAADAVWRLVCPYSDPVHAFGSHSSGIAAVAGLGLLLAGWWEISRARVLR